tara:strand:- start:255 stop:584 length:330 start_codon:yes stop_codon:yes gene_type:complete
MPKYGRRKSFMNNYDLYSSLLEPRGVEGISQYDTFTFSKKIIKSSYAVREHVWSKGDRLYKIAHKYYGDDEFWWIIALWNGKPTDADYVYGATVYIPFPPMKIYRELAA